MVKAFLFQLETRMMWAEVPVFKLSSDIINKSYHGAEIEEVLIKQRFFVPGRISVCRPKKFWFL